MNYYVALRFKGRPDLHMTLWYYEDVTEEALSHITARVGRIVTGKGRFNLLLTDQRVLGYKNRVKALVACRTVLPEWLSSITGVSWLPHVTTTEERLALTVDAVAIMCKDKEIVRWRLT